MGQESPSIDSVFDFLYVDHVRIAVLLSQLEQHNYGHLESVKVTDEARESFKKTGSASALALRGQLESGTETNERAERSYNPLWLHARQFLDIFDELGFIQRDLSKASYGDLVVASGNLTVVDPRFMRPLWRTIMGAMPEVQKAMVQGLTESGAETQSRQQRRAAARASQNSSVPPSAQQSPESAFAAMIAGFLEAMPHAVRGRLTSDEQVLWFMLVPERMSVTPEEIVLKHGTIVPGEWHVAGLVDAIPGETPTAAPAAADSLHDAVTTATSSLQEQMGRPKTDYGITPLLIFRKMLSSNYAPPSDK